MPLGEDQIKLVLWWGGSLFLCHSTHDGTMMQHSILYKLGKLPIEMY